MIQCVTKLPSYWTEEGFEIHQFEVDAFANVATAESAQVWFSTFEEHSKTTMPQTKGYEIKGKRVILRESRHCIHSAKVRCKQGNLNLKRQTIRNRNIDCSAIMHLRLERRNLSFSHPLEIKLQFTHNHVINSAQSLSFRRVKDETRESFIQMFHDGHSPASALYTYEDNLHISALSDEELVEILADRATNPGYVYVAHLFNYYRDSQLGKRNGTTMFQRLTKEVISYNASGRGQAIIQEYDSRTGKAYILCIVTGLMKRVHEQIRQAGELCYIDASASFESLNTSITLLYTSCLAGALPLGLFITSDELEVTIERAINLLKKILPENAFFGRGPDVGPQTILTDDSAAERNALELCWPKSIRLLCTFHVLQAFWRWLYDSKHGVKKEHRTLIMDEMKKVLYAKTETDMNVHYQKLKDNYYQKYPLLKKHYELLWNRRQYWAHSFRYGLLLRGNNTNNYIERSFGLLKDIIFARTKAFNSIQVFHFIINNMERFYERRLFGFAHGHSGHMKVAKRFLCPGWESVDENSIQKTIVENEYLVPSTNKESGLVYIVNSSIGTCSCFIGMSGAPCKHQGAVAAKYHIGMINFLPSLSPDDRMIFSFIASGKNFFFLIYLLHIY